MRGSSDPPSEIGRSPAPPGIGRSEVPLWGGAPSGMGASPPSDIGREWRWLPGVVQGEWRGGLPASE